MEKLMIPVQKVFVQEKRTERIAQIVLLILSISYSVIVLM